MTDAEHETELELAGYKIALAFATDVIEKMIKTYENPVGVPSEVAYAWLKDARININRALNNK